ncbi:hypothetical protein P4O66_014202 [Electrophorus voltai]|uniref:Sine oculis-binding protein homolog n=1 Tax=Electrophorus voltai TaxID=2609070 RepID=A0AAD8Z0E8_9TELE|nr:hypothetical protein P4O66_014202 [Electrophorus voltai]
MPKMEKGRPPENKRSRKPAHPVKREVSQEMKNFAESTMNELLGWYGYDKVELQDSEASDVRSRVRRHHVSVLKENSDPKPCGGENKGMSGSSASNGGRESICFPLSPSSSSSSPRSKDMHSTRAVVPIIKPSVVEEPQSVRIVCVWCQQEGLKRYCLVMGSELKSFCSEKCFAMCRRAYFKRNKAREEDRHADQSPPPPGQTVESPPRLLPKTSGGTRVCDWCKHVRHTKYLDFGAGEERLQFCSTKCLNQYKMDIFYREARAALTATGTGSSPRPTEQDSGPALAARDGHALLTPESWDSPGKALSPKASASVPSTVPAFSSSASSSGRTSVSAQQPRERESSGPPQLQAAGPPGPPAAPPPPALEQPRLVQNFSRTHFHAQAVHNPAQPLPCELGTSPAQRPAHTSPHVHTPSSRPLHPPHILQPYPGSVLPCPPAYPHPIPPLVPSLGLPCPQTTLLVPYPIIVPLPVPVPIPVPIPMNSGVMGHTRVIRNHGEKEERDAYASSVITADVGREKSEAEIADHSLAGRRVKTERPPSPPEPWSPPFSPQTSQRSSAYPELHNDSLAPTARAAGQRDESTERQVIQRVLRRLPVKQESEAEVRLDFAGHREQEEATSRSRAALDDDASAHRSAMRNTDTFPAPSEDALCSPLTHTSSPTHTLTPVQSTHSSLVLRKALNHCGGNTASVVTPTASILLNHTAAAPSSACSRSLSPTQASSMSSDRLDPSPEHRTHASQIPALPQDSEDVKENLAAGRDLVLKCPCPGEQTDCQTDQSEESRGRAVEGDGLTADEEHTYARSIPPKLREKNAHAFTHKTAAHTLSQLITHTWDKSSHTQPQTVEQGGVHLDAEPALKRRCLCIRDENK